MRPMSLAERGVAEKTVSLADLLTGRQPPVTGDSPVTHLRWLASRLGDDLLDAVVITTGPHAYRRPDGIAVVPAALLGA